MGSLGRIFSLLIIATLAASSLTILQTTTAQTIPKPSVPEFTVKYVNASYNVTTSNPYTGLDEIKQISNNSIEVLIKNQPIEFSNHQIYFNVRVKPGFSDDIIGAQIKLKSYFI